MMSFNTTRLLMFFVDVQKRPKWMINVSKVKRVAQPYTTK